MHARAGEADRHIKTKMVGPPLICHPAPRCLCGVALPIVSLTIVHRNRCIPRTAETSLLWKAEDGQDEPPIVPVCCHVAFPYYSLTLCLCSAAIHLNLLDCGQCHCYVVAPETFGTEG